MPDKHLEVAADGGGWRQGGGSVQMAFAMRARDAKKAPEGYITSLAGAGKKYDVYVHRWA